MDEYKKEFAKLLCDTKALFFDKGLVLKDKRPTPYFVNMGKFCSGKRTSQLGTYYADMLVNTDMIDKIDIIIGPSYKGSAIASATVSALWNKYKIDKLFDYDRKEAKTHGDKNKNFVNNVLFNGARVYVVDDVGTSMATKYETIHKIKAEAESKGMHIKIVGIGLGVDREQSTAVYDPEGQVQLDMKGEDAIGDFVNKTGIPVQFVGGISELINYIYDERIPLMVNGHLQPMPLGAKEEFDSYLATYGVRNQSACCTSGACCEKLDKAKSMLCLPLDVPTIEDAEKLVEELHEFVGVFKIGKELFTNYGPDAIKMVHEKGGKVFLDLKFHDIPNTVKGAAKAATRMGVFMFNIHASGGADMMCAALKGVEEGVREYGVEKPKVIAVSILTSIDEGILNRQLHVPGAVADQVMHLATLADGCGLDGIVCSPADLPVLKDKLRGDFMYVTPGVKGVSTAAGADQKRVCTPGVAVESGSSILVVGRAITAAPDRRAAAKEILEDMAKHL